MPARRFKSRSSAGFTLIETMVAVTITGILSSLAYPSLDGHVLRARRGDALVSIMQTQLAEERWRANSNRYGSLAEIGATPTSLSGHYAMAVAYTANDYTVQAVAAGGQSRDAGCRHMSLTVSGGNLGYASGPEASVANAAAQNRRCWSQ